MNTAQRYNLRDRFIKLARRNKFLLVTHSNADDDAAASITLFCKCLKLNPWNIQQVSYAFVNPGSLYQGAVPPGTLVVHFDTGGQFDPERLILDHHYKNCPWLSTTDVIYHLFYKDVLPRIPQFVEDLRAYANITDNRHRHFTDAEWEQLAKTKKALADIRDERGVPKVQLLTKHQAIFRGLTMASHNVPHDIGSGDFLQTTHLLNLLYHLYCIHEMYRKIPLQKELLAQSQIYRVKGANEDSLTIATLPPSNLSPSTIRDQAFHDLDLKINGAHILISPLEGRQSSYGNFMILILKEDKKVAGMEALAAAIREQNPSGAFLHDKEFIIFVKAPCTLDLNQLLGLAFRYLRLKT